MCTPLRGKSAKLSTFPHHLAGNMKSPNITTVCSQAGGANALVPVLRRLASSSAEIHSLCEGPARDIFDWQGLDYVEELSKDSLDEVIGMPHTDLVLLGQACPENGKLTVEQRAVPIARKQNVRSVSISDFWTSRHLCFSGGSKSIDCNLLPDCITVIDETNRNIMIKEGFPASKLIVTGNPHFDSLERKARDDRLGRNIREKYGITADCLIFHPTQLLTNYENLFGYNDLDVLRVLDDAQISGGSVFTLIKMHPGTSQKNQNEIARYVAGMTNARVVFEESTQDLVLASDLVVTSHSTVGIEALLMERPVVSVQPGLCKENRYQFVTKTGLVPVGFTHEECRDLLRCAATDKAYRFHLVDNAKSFRTDGQATERVVSLIYDQIRN